MTETAEIKVREPVQPGGFKNASSMQIRRRYFGNYDEEIDREEKDQAESQIATFVIPEKRTRSLA